MYSFREEDDTKGVRIVDAHSSTIGYFHETRGFLHINHRNIAKFTKEEAYVMFQIAMCFGEPFSLYDFSLRSTILINLQRTIFRNGKITYKSNAKSFVLSISWTT